MKTLVAIAALTAILFAGCSAPDNNRPTGNEPKDADIVLANEQLDEAAEALRDHADLVEQGCGNAVPVEDSLATLRAHSLVLTGIDTPRTIKAAKMVDEMITLTETTFATCPSQ